MTKLEIWLLGRFVVRREDEEVPAREFGGRRVRTLIRVLTSRPGQLVSKDALTEALWDEHLPANPVANLEVLVHRARRTLGDRSLITTGTGGYAFAGNEGCLIDVEEFRRLTDIGRVALAEGDWESARDSFGRALEWWRGEPLIEDTYAEWAQPVRTELARLHLEALEGAAGAALQLGDVRRAVEFAEMAVAREPLREAGRMLLMQALYLSGGQGRGAPRLRGASPTARGRARGRPVPGRIAAPPRDAPRRSTDRRLPAGGRNRSRP